MITAEPILVTYHYVGEKLEPEEFRDLAIHQPSAPCKGDVVVLPGGRYEVVRVEWHIRRYGDIGSGYITEVAVDCQ